MDCSIGIGRRVARSPITNLATAYYSNPALGIATARLAISNVALAQARCER
jgi:hypothetical protein